MNVDSCKCLQCNKKIIRGKIVFKKYCSFECYEKTLTTGNCKGCKKNALLRFENQLCYKYCPELYAQKRIDKWADDKYIKNETKCMNCNIKITKFDKYYNDVKANYCVHCNGISMITHVTIPKKCYNCVVY